MEGVFGDGRKTAVCGSPASRRGDGRTLQRVRHLPQDRLQDLRSLPGMRSAGADRQEPASLSLCQSTSFSGRKLHSEREARAPQLGCSQNSRAVDPPVLRYSDSGQKHHPCGAGSPRSGRAPRSRATSRPGHGVIPRTESQRVVVHRLQGRVLARQSSILLPADRHRSRQPFSSDL